MRRRRFLSRAFLSRARSSAALGAGLIALVTATLVGPAGPASGEPPAVRAELRPAVRPALRPVLGRVVAGFRAPLTRYGRGHLGVDFAARPGAAVRAVEAGTVEFAGRVGTARHVVVRDARGRRVSYSFLASIRVRIGARVRRGEAIGTTGGTGPHHGGGVLHLGLRIGDTYVDPMRLFVDPVGTPFGVHLVPYGPIRRF
jgi:murein DD-endopeptidase MepM/ murein hydrolase activator NlpD